MIKSFIFFIRLIYLQRHLIFSMAKREIKSQYVGSLLGFIWTFVQPFVMILVLWLVFSVGFRATPLNNVPFVVWLTAGMASWTLFTDIILGSAGVIIANASLIKKTQFHSHILPVIRIASGISTHLIFLIILTGLILFQKMPLSLFFLQFLYYLFCLIVLALGISWAISAMNVFVRDIGHITAVVIQIGFWATPIFWDMHIMPPKLQTILKLNPMFYIVQGYRDSFIYFVPFWKHPYLTLYFWVVTLICFVAGAMIFKTLKPQFADVL